MYNALSLGQECFTAVLPRTKATTTKNKTSKQFHTEEEQETFSWLPWQT